MLDQSVEWPPLERSFPASLIQRQFSRPSLRESWPVANRAVWHPGQGSRRLRTDVAAMRRACVSLLTTMGARPGRDLPPPIRVLGASHEPKCCADAKAFCHADAGRPMAVPAPRATALRRIRIRPILGVPTARQWPCPLATWTRPALSAAPATATIALHSARRGRGGRRRSSSAMPRSQRLPLLREHRSRKRRVHAEPASWVVRRAGRTIQRPCRHRVSS